MVVLLLKTVKGVGQGGSENNNHPNTYNCTYGINSNRDTDTGTCGSQITVLPSVHIPAGLTAQKEAGQRVLVS